MSIIAENKALEIFNYEKCWGKQSYCFKIE